MVFILLLCHGLTRDICVHWVTSGKWQWKTCLEEYVRVRLCIQSYPVQPDRLSFCEKAYLWWFVIGLQMTFSVPSPTFHLDLFHPFSPVSTKIILSFWLPINSYKCKRQQAWTILVAKRAELPVSPPELAARRRSKIWSRTNTFLLSIIYDNHIVSLIKDLFFSNISRKCLDWFDKFLY